MTGEKKKRQQELKACVDLGVFYLRTKQLDKALPFFQTLYVHQQGVEKPPAIQTLGTLGVGIVYGLQAKTAQDARKSNGYLEMVNNDGQPRDDGQPLRDIMLRVALRPWVKDALDHNGKLEKLPPKLAELRRELNVRANKGG
jgi:hypothetical protein